MLICEKCGEAKDDVEECYDPYKNEVYAEMVKIVVCEDCYRGISDEV